MVQNPQWSADSVLTGFEATTLHYPDDYEGKVYATLVRRNAAEPTQQTVLYIHGYIDYFFQSHVADAFNERGYNFYALDLRKYGRSLDASHHPNFCKDIKEYFPEINDAIQIILAEGGHQSLTLMGHSTGGLICSLYAHAGPYRDRLNALVLNSPFFDWHLPAATRTVIKLLAAIGGLFPFLAIARNEPVPYFVDIYNTQKGEWEMNEAWRPINGFPVFAGWSRAINRAHAQVHAGLNVQCPVLVMSSDKSIMTAKWHPDVSKADVVLDVKHIEAGSKQLGKDVHYIQIPDGIHDLYLSPKPVREKAFEETFAWLNKLDLAVTQQ